jgi:hypothetical protein
MKTEIIKNLDLLSDVELERIHKMVQEFVVGEIETKISSCTNYLYRCVKEKSITDGSVRFKIKKYNYFFDENRGILYTKEGENKIENHEIYKYSKDKFDLKKLLHESWYFFFSKKEAIEHTMNLSIAYVEYDKENIRREQENIDELKNMLENER